jgi:hypothetical protein
LIEKTKFVRLKNIEIKKMQSTTGLNKVDAIIAEVNKNGIVAENLIKQLEELREIAKVEQDPLVVKTLRLVYFYIEDEGYFDLNLLAEEEIDELEEEETEGVEFEDQLEEEEEEEEVSFELVEDFEERRENFVYFLNLIKDSQNEYNRIEIKKIRTFLWNEIYG